MRRVPVNPEARDAVYCDNCEAVRHMAVAGETISDKKTVATEDYNEGVIKAAVAKMLHVAADDLEKTKGSGRTYNAAIEWPTLITIENEEGGPAALRAVADQLVSTEPIIALSEVKEALLGEEAVDALQNFLWAHADNTRENAVAAAEALADVALPSDGEGER